MSKLNININKDNHSLNEYLYCWNIFDKVPNKIVIHNTYETATLLSYLGEISNLISKTTEIIPDDAMDVINDRVLFNITDDIYISFIIMDKLSKNSIISDVNIFYKNYENEINVEKIINDLDKFSISYEEDSIIKLAIISLNGSVMDIEPLEIKDIFNEGYYSKNSLKSIKSAIKKVKKANKGILLIKGEKGTGKTTLIKKISNEVDRIVIYIPNTMLDITINNSEFRKVLKKYDRPIIVLDDFERNNNYINNIINIVDGLQSDNLNTTFVLIQNLQVDDDFDDDLLESNSLIDIVNIELLSKDEANKLAKSLGNNKTYKNNTKLIDIINKKDSISKKIGY